MPSRTNSEIAAPMNEAGLRPANRMAPLDGFTIRPTPEWPGLAAKSPLAKSTLAKPTAVEPMAVRPKVLVADEDALCREVLVRVLGAEYNVATACSGEEVLAKVQAERPQLVVLSATLPSSLQQEICCALCGDRELRGAPLVLMLGTDCSADDRADALECGAADYLEKPFGMREFAARVRVLLRPRAQWQ